MVFGLEFHVNDYNLVNYCICLPHSKGQIYKSFFISYFTSSYATNVEFVGNKIFKVFVIRKKEGRSLSRISLDQNGYYTQNTTFLLN